MHELHNPGSAAKRAASQLRENLLRLQDLSLRSAGKPKTPDQLECMHNLLQHAVKSCHAPAMSTTRAGGRGRGFGGVAAKAGVENAFTIAPSLVAIGFEQEELRCAREYFDASSFSDALNWLEALVSSVSLVCAIEESISRVSDLAMAVKKFAYDERSPAQRAGCARQPAEHADDSGAQAAHESRSQWRSVLQRRRRRFKRAVRR